MPTRLNQTDETDGQRCSWCEEPLTPRRTIHLHRYQFCPTCHKRVFDDLDAAKQLFKGIF